MGMFDNVNWDKANEKEDEKIFTLHGWQVENHGSKQIVSVSASFFLSLTLAIEYNSLSRRVIITLFGGKIITMRIELTQYKELVRDWEQTLKTKKLN